MARQAWAGPGNPVAVFHPLIGRPSTPAECYPRLMFLKYWCRLGFESLRAKVSDSISWRRFCRIPLDGKGTAPDDADEADRPRCGSAAVAGLNEALLARAAGEKPPRTARLRVDTTVVPANVSYPTDPDCLREALHTIAREVAKSLCASQQPACRPLHDLQQPNWTWKLKTVIKVGLTKRG